MDGAKYNWVLFIISVFTNCVNMVYDRVLLYFVLKIGTSQSRPVSVGNGHGRYCP